MSVTRGIAPSSQKMEKPLQLVYNIDGKLQLNPEALNVLQSIDDPMLVVAMVGAARTGKSYLMNCLAGDKNGFSVDSTTEAHTKGIWMWCRSLPQRPNEVLLLLDTKGLGDPEVHAELQGGILPDFPLEQQGDTHNDNSLYTLAILLSSILIYNGKSKIDQQSLQDLHFVTELSKRIQMKSQPDGSDSWHFVRVFPEFVWVIRDLTLELSIDDEDVTPNEYLEHILKLKDSESSEQDKKYNELCRSIRENFPSRCCFAFPIPALRKKLNRLQDLMDKDLDEDFVMERQNLIKYIDTHEKVKRLLGGQPVTGRRFVELSKAYVNMMANGVIACVENVVTQLVKVENQAAMAEALKFYENEMNKLSNSDLTMRKLIQNYNMKSREAFDIFHKRSMNDNSGKHKQLEEKLKAIYTTHMYRIKEKSVKQCKAHLTEVMSSIQQKLKSQYYLKPSGFWELKKDLDEAIKKYEKKTKNEMEGCAVIVHFLEEEKPHLDHVQEMDSQLTEEQKRVSALEEELSRLKQKIEKREQERKETEERRNQEITSKINKKFEEGKKCRVQELKEAMEHMKSEMEKYEDEGRMEDAERARQRYEYLKKKYEKATRWRCCIL